MAFGTRLRDAASAAVLACLALSGCNGEEAPAEREASSSEPSAEAATVNGQIIYVSDVEMEARMKGVIREGETLEPESAEFNEILDQLIDIKLMAMEALERSLDEEPEARHRLTTARDNILGNILLEHIADEEIDEASVRRMYEEQVSLLVLENEARVRHIQAPTKEAIDKVVAELKAGGDFIVVAARRSTDQITRMDGGDLGYMTAEEATPEFAKVIRETPAGGISKPFEDAQGWHVVKIEELRKAQPPTIDKLRGPIEEFLRRTKLEEVLKELRGGAEISKKTSPRNSRLDAPDEPRVAPKPAAPAETPAAPAVVPPTTPPSTTTGPAPAPATPAPAPAAPATTPPATPPATTPPSP